MPDSLLAVVLLACLALALRTLTGPLDYLAGLRGNRAASMATGARLHEVSLQYDACPTQGGGPWAVEHDMEAHLVAAALRQAPAVQQGPQQAVLRGVLAFLRRAPSQGAQTDPDTFAEALEGFVGATAEQAWQHFGSNRSLSKYFNCPLLSVSSILERVSCELPCGRKGLGLAASGKHIESQGMHNLLGFECLFTSDSLEGCMEASVSHISLKVHLDTKVKASTGRTTLRVQMCATEIRPHVLAACTQPLYDHARMAAASPHFVHDWLLYHESIGIDHFHVYDIDGSFSGDLSPFVEKGLVSYYPFWADRFPGALSMTTRSHGAPLCTELLAYSHCLVTNHLASAWVMLLHAPDEYVAPGVSANGRRLELGELLASAEGGGVLRGASELQVLHFPYARHGPCLEGSRVSAVRCSLQRAALADVTRGSPMLNPDVCVVSDAHHCIAALPGEGCEGRHGVPWTDRGRRQRLPSTHCREEPPHFRLPAQQVPLPDLNGLLICSRTSPDAFFLDPAAIKLNHYVEMLSEDIGRCKDISRMSCSVWDESLLWAADYVGRVTDSLETH